MRCIICALSNFHRDQRASTSIIFALSVISLCGFIGGAVDMALYVRAQTAHTEAIDAAALAAARLKQTGSTDIAAIDHANMLYALSTNAIDVNGKATFSVSPDGRAVTGSGDLATPSVFLRVIGINELKFRVRNRAEFKSPTAVEMSLMLDTTGSMAGSKIADLKAAVETLIDVVIHADGDGNSRIAMAPFSSAVTLGPKQFREATGNTTGGGGCVVERSNGAYDDSSPGAGAYLTALSDKKTCKAAEAVFPLTNKKSDLKKMIKSLSASGSTAGHLGTAWAWYLLSPNWSTVFDESARPGPYTELTQTLPDGSRKLRKIAVLMTDGEYNTSHNGIDATTQARAICAAMRTTKVEVYTVGFDVDPTGAVAETLRQCASMPVNFYLATDGAALNAAFLDIAKKASTVRLAE